MLEAECSTCGETFIPADDTDTIHLVRSDGVECGGQGVITGEWIFPVRHAESLTHKGEAHYLMSPDDVPAHIERDHGMSLDEVMSRLPDNDHDVRRWLAFNKIESTGDAELDAYTMWHEEEHAERRLDQAPAWLMRDIWVRVINAMSLVEWRAYQNNRCKVE